MAKGNLLTTRYLTDEDKVGLIQRLNRASGQVTAVRKMIEASDCVDKILLQLGAAKAALTEVALELVREHLVNCATTCMEGDREEVIRRMTRAASAVLRNA